MQPQDHQSKIFTFDHNGRQYTLPRFKNLKGGVLRRTRRLSPLDMMFTMFEEIADEQTLAALDDMDTADLEELQQRWLEDSGVTVGESSTSST